MAYRRGVLINNWYEEVCASEEMESKFLKDWYSRNLLVQKTQSTFLNLNKPVRLHPKSDFISFDSIVQFVFNIAPRTNNIKLDSDLKTPTLAILISEDKIPTNQTIYDECELSITMATSSNVRNSFRIVSPDGKSRSNEYLKYGDNFCIECIEAKDPNTVVYCAPASSQIVEPKFEIYNRKSVCSSPLGLIAKKNTGKNCAVPTYYTYWNCQSTSPSNRMETIGNSVQNGGTIIIAHTATGRFLAGENICRATLFGTEYFVMVNSYTDNYRREQWQNLWKICVGNE